MSIRHCSVGVRSALLGVAFLGISGFEGAWAQSTPERTSSGLVALYDFNESDGATIPDRSRAGEPVNLRISNMRAVRRTPGALEVRGDTLIQSDGPATRIINAIRRSGEITIEAWIQPAETGQTGPARIVTLSQDTGRRNFTLGQDEDKFDVRLRTTSTSTNGIPSLSTKPRTLTTELTHVVYTHDRSGRTRIYVNGELQAEQTVAGDMSNWDDSFRLALGNELTGDRPWRGTYYLVAIYSRALLPREVEQNFIAGAEVSSQNVANRQTVPRTSSGLVALYDFSEREGATVTDRSGAGEPVNLRVSDMKSVRRSSGALEVRGDTLIQSEGPARRIIDAIRRSGEVTIEAWIRPAETGLGGPARIVTLSQDTGQRNLTLGQDEDKFDVRLRTTSTSTNGIPSLSTKPRSLTTELTHVVYTHDRSGRTRIYVNGKQEAEEAIAGDTSNWDDSCRLALCNELTGDRPWRGTYYLVAIYSRALLPREVEQNQVAGAAASPQNVANRQTGARASGGLLALYEFNESSGAVIEDRSGAGDPLNLQIVNTNAVRRRGGGLEIRGQTLIQSAGPASKIIDGIGRSGEITIEAWLRPADTGLSGPARIVTLSANPNERDFTLGQDGDRFDVRLRTNSTSTNGIPSLSSRPGSLTTNLTHVVYTHAHNGRSRIYVNGELNAEETIAGPAANWDGSFRLGLADEITGERPWRGVYYLVAVYGRDLSPGEIVQNYRAGVDAGTLLAGSETGAGSDLFRTAIAPLLARSCLECHDTSSKKGGLDLSRHEAVLAGGDSGAVIQPGNPAESLLWERVAADEMPADRTPLTDPEKMLLRQWIDSGANWSLEFIDPLVYGRDQPAPDNLLRRLTVAEYIETVKQAVGVDISDDARRLLPPDVRADGFSNTAYNLNVDLEHVEAYAELARIIVERMDVAAFARKYTRNRQLTDNNMRDLITKMGKWLLRGPLEEREVVNYRGISTTVAAAGGGFEEAVRFTIEAMLQSPRFIYRVENQRGDGSAWPVGDYELASRLSYIIWGGPPDAELLRAAESGDLYDRNGIETQVRRMLEDPRAVERSAQFISEWLDLARLDNLQPNRERFPDWDPRLAADMREETLAYFKDVVWDQGRPLADLLNAQVTFATPRLAEHYGLQPSGPGLRRYDLSRVPGRGGLLTQGSLLTAGGDDASMVSRGLFVLHDFLRGAVKDPPPCVDTTPVPTKPGLTQRGIAEARIANVSCGGCHGKFEPLAFGLEKFDGLGSYHERDEYGNELRDDGEILFPGAAEAVPYASSAELMDLLAGSDRVQESLTWKVTQFALGRPLVAADAPIVEQIHQTAQKNGGTYANLITAVVLSDLVLTKKTEAEQ